MIVGGALWRGADGPLHGEAVVDDTTLFDGDVAGVRVEPTAALPGLRAACWVVGRVVGWPGGRPVGLHRGNGHPRRRARPPADTALDVLPAHPGLVAGPVVSNGERSRPARVGATEPIFLAIVALTACGGVLAWLAGPTLGRWPMSGCSSS
ncbi:hypothetical protein I552_7408 [Mycobacterium xenopi 3993]|nr:hypothetical protein I552_7408 [Mycobacterium xenopi 3993]